MDLSRVINGKKFMWDGRTYDNEQEMKKVLDEYREKGFESEAVNEDGKFYLFTRRLVTEVIVEGSPI
jgi:hypothetical protein